MFLSEVLGQNKHKLQSSGAVPKEIRPVEIKL